MRTCGDCIVCCVYLKIDVPELRKEGMRHCPHVKADEPEVIGERVCYTGTGCKVHGDHPPVCKGYNCAWLRGHGTEEDRPDRCGVLMDNLKGVKNAVECKPIWDGAANDAAGVFAIQRISASMGVPALVTSFYERHLVRVEGGPWRQ
jgi:hypothetical protein